MPRTSRGTAREFADDGRRIYSLGDVTTSCEVPRPQAQYWLKHRLIVPDYEASGGPGTYHGFTFRNLIEFAIAKSLAEIGATTDVMRWALIALRSEDPEDDYSEMPRMRAAIDSQPRKKKPSRKEALAWFDAQGDRVFNRPRQFTDPDWVAEFERHVDVLPFPLRNKKSSKELAEKLVKWRRFKDPCTGPREMPTIVFGQYQDAKGRRVTTSAPVRNWKKVAELNTARAVVLFCGSGLADVAFTSTELYELVGIGTPAALVNLTRVFTDIENATGDHWNKTNWATETERGDAGEQRVKRR